MKYHECDIFSVSKDMLKLSYDRLNTNIRNDGVTSKLYKILIPHTKVTRESALNVCKTKLKIKHKPDHKGFKEDSVDDGMQGFLHAILDREIFNLTERECAISLL